MLARTKAFGKLGAPMRRGFTLIEILIVLGIIAILASIVIIAINPAKQFAQARDTQRQSDVEAILNAIGQRMADNEGIFAGSGCPTIASATTSIHNAGSDSSDFGTDCLVPTYLAALPVDPSNPTAPDTGYTVSANSNGRTLVCAPFAAAETALQNPSAICVLR